METNDRQDHTGNFFLPIAYQTDFVDKVLSLPQPARVVLVAPTGTGKSVTLAALVKSLERRLSRSARALVLVPADLADSWVTLLERQGLADPVQMDAPTLRRIEAETSVAVNPWSVHARVVVHTGFLGRQERLEAAMAAGWDIVILDEASSRMPGNQMEGTIQQLWASDRVPIAVAAMRALPEPPHFWEPESEIVSWGADLLRSSGTEAPSPPRTLRIHRYDPSLQEQAFEDGVASFLSGLPETLWSGQARAVILAMLRSSPFAVEMMLRRVASLADAVPQQGRGFWLSRAELPNLDGTGENARWPAPPAELWTPDACHQLLELLESIDRDSKWEVCRDLLRDRQSAGKPVAIFTDYADTARYVASIVEETGQPVGLLTTGSGPEEKSTWRSWLGSKAASFVVTTGASLTENLSFVPDVVHYDVPATVEGLRLRCGRVEAINRTDEITHHFIVPAGSTEEERVLALWSQLDQSQ